MRPRIAAAVSGGIDSLTAAFILKNKGFSVTGLHFVTGYESVQGRNGYLQGNSTDKRSNKDQLADARRKMGFISNQLKIPVQVLDLSKEFKKCVVDNFIRTYRTGKTPNPCLVCNPSIKFGILFKHAKTFGASFIATGHYARIQKANDGSFRLLKGVDSSKDQSYFLGFMSQRQLGQACFPLGAKTKAEVKRLAEQNGLVSLTKEESQDICFVREKSYGDFLAKKFPPKPGKIVDTSGKVIGEHNGLHLFTIGQRRGINCPSSEPYYVVRIDAAANRLVVGAKSELLRTECRVESVNWLQERPTSLFCARTRVRYRHKAAESEVTPTGKNAARVRFKTPQEALTPGQGAVFYKNDEVIGAGWISGGV